MMSKNGVGRFGSIQPPTCAQCVTAIALTLYREPARIERLSERVDPEWLGEIVCEVAALIEEFPVLSQLFAGELLTLAEQLPTPDEVLRKFAWLELMPEATVADLPSFEQALDTLVPMREKLEPIGIMRRWQSDLRKCVDGQRAASPATWKLNHLWRAACYEAAAFEYEHAGLYAAADDSMNAAARAFAAGAPDLETAA